MVSLEGGGDDHEVCVAYFGFPYGFQCSGGYHFLQHGLKARLDDVELAGVGLGYDIRVDVHSCYLYSVFGSDDSCRKAYVSEAHKTCFHIF